MTEKKKKIIIVAVTCTVAVAVIIGILILCFSGKDTKSEHKKQKQPKTVTEEAVKGDVSEATEEAAEVTPEAMQPEEPVMPDEGIQDGDSLADSGNGIVQGDSGDFYVIGDPPDEEEDEDIYAQSVAVPYVDYQVPEGYYCGTSEITKEIADAIISDVLGKTTGAVYNTQWRSMNHTTTMKADRAYTSDTVQTDYFANENYTVGDFHVIEEQNNWIKMGYTMMYNDGSGYSESYEIKYSLGSWTDNELSVYDAAHTPEEIAINIELRSIFKAVKREFALIYRSGSVDILEGYEYLGSAHSNKRNWTYFMTRLKEDSTGFNLGKEGNGIPGIDEQRHNLYVILHSIIKENEVIKTNVTRLGYSNFLEYENSQYGIY